MGTYDVGVACLNGHEINSTANRHPELNAKFCDKCGEAAIAACTRCNATIRGDYFVPGVAVFSTWRIPAYCHDCGHPYPWTQRKAEAISEAIDELDQLGEVERQKLKESISDVLVESPGTDTAIVRFKKAMGKAGSLGGKLLYDVLIKVAAEQVNQSLRGGP